MAAFTTVDDPGVFFNTVLYSGDSSSPRGITGVGFQPDMLWEEKRNATANKYSFDSIRGVGGSAKQFELNQTAANSTQANMIQSFDSDGFTQGSDMNASGTNYCAWCWKMGTTTGIATSGSETLTPSAYSFNQSSGCSIIQYTGSTRVSDILPHGLGAVPGAIFVKNQSSAVEWAVYNKGMDSTAPEDYYTALNTSAATVNSTGTWNDTAPDSVNFTIGTDDRVNSTDDYIAYCFAPVKGYSAFGAYRGTGNANGVFIYTGFRPAFFLSKNIDTTSSWCGFDNRRAGFNPDNDQAYFQDTDADSTTDRVTFCSNGMWLNYVGEPNNLNNWFYFAFAESPFVNSNGVPSNAV